MDGGSITLNYTDQSDQIQTIEIVQNVSVEFYKELSKIPGRIYVNNELIDMRSSEEIYVVEQLKNNINCQHNKLDKAILIEKIEWIESNEYLELQPTIKKLSEKRKQHLRNQGYKFQDEQ